MIKTFCPKCYGAGTVTEWRSYGDDNGDEWEDTYECYECDGTGEVEYVGDGKPGETVSVSESGRQTIGVASCGVPESGHNCTCGNS